jgi:hypothetical protein
MDDDVGEASQSPERYCAACEVCFFFGLVKLWTSRIRIANERSLRILECCQSRSRYTI